MTTLYSLTSTIALANLRTDLSDTVATYRFADSDLTRAIDKAVERYSWANPWIQSIQLQAIKDSLIYASPISAFYIDRVEYPLGHYPKNFQPFFERKSPLVLPPSFAIQPNSGPPTISLAGGGNLSAGLYTWAVTYTTPAAGETTGSPTFTATATTGQQATIANIPIGPYGVTGRNVYRTIAGGSQLKFAGQILDNSTGTFVDGLADGSLGANIPLTNTSANLDAFELQLPPELVPIDTTQLLEIQYATKHYLATDGTTIPERHWDVLYLGAVAFAIWAYLPQVNDNFEYADGHLRDRVDDTKSTTAWHTHQQHAMQDFDSALKRVREEANTGIQLGVLKWGDKPLRWERL